MKKEFRLIVLMLLITLLAACSPAPSKPASLADLDRDGLGSYSAIFEIQFSGPTNWIYQLRTRASDQMREGNLFIQGIDKSQNPGDVRIVTDQTTTWMIGAGTDNECVQFPNDQGMDPAMIYPETLISVADMARLLTLAGEEKIGNKTALHYTGAGLTVGNWQDARVDVWQDKASQALLRFSMQASGEDAFFGTGTGTLKVRYEVDSFTRPSIEPVAGCEINAPLPKTASGVVRLPGMASFETTDGSDVMAAFYQAGLPPAGWAEREPPAQSDGSTILSYIRGAENLEIHLEGTVEGGTKVKLIFLQTQ